MNFTSLDVLGISSPVVDKILCISDEYLRSLSIEKGANRALLNQPHDSIIQNSHQIPIISPGGPSANALQLTSFLGQQCAIFGKVGKDDTGAFYRRKLESKNIIPLLTESLSPTAQVLSLVTPDGERTICPILGAAKEVSSIDLKEEYFEKTKLVLIDGYNLYYDDLPEKAMFYAKKHGAKIAFDFSSYELITTFKDRVFDLLKNSIDLVFANEKEAWTLCELPPEQASRYLASFTDISILMMGEDGCWVSSQQDNSIYQPAFATEAKDTTGAGDVFVGAFIHCYLEKFSLIDSARIACLSASECVQVLGAELPSESLGNILENMPKVLAANI